MFAALRLGWKLKSPGRIHVLIGVVFLGVFAVGVGALEGTYQGMSEREFLRSPGFQQATTDDVTGTNREMNHEAQSEDELGNASLSPQDSEAQLGAKKNEGPLRLLWVPSWGTNQAHGYLLDPRTENAPLPPGMSKWLAPGEVALSPALARQYRPGTMSPFGRVQALIPEEALSDPAELFFYSRPTGPLPEHWGIAVDSFSGSDLVVNGDALNLPPQPHAILFLVIFLAFPGAFLCLTGIFQSFALRDASALLRDIGFGARTRLACGVGTMLLPISAATLITVLIIGITCVKPIHLPLVGVILSPPDLRSQLPLTATIYCTQVLLVIFACGLNSWFTFHTRPATKLHKLIARLSQFSVLPSLVFVWAFATLNELRGLTLQIVFFGALLSLGMAIPTVSLWVAEMVSNLLHKLNPSAVAIIARRKLRAHGPSLIVSLLGMSLTLVSLAGAQLYASQLSAPMKQALRVDAGLGNRFLEIKIPGFTVQEAEELSKKLSSAGGIIIATSPEEKTGATVLKTDQKAREVLKLPDRDIDNQDLATTDQSAVALDIIGGDTFSIRTEIPSRVPLHSLFLVSDQQLDMESVSQATISMGAVTSRLGSNWIGGVKILSDKVNWFILLGFPAALALIIAFLTSTNQQAKKRLKLRELVDILALPTSINLAITGLIAFLPTLVCAALSCLAYSALATGFSSRFGASTIVSPSFQITLFIVGAIGAVYGSALIYQDSRRNLQV